MENEIFLLKAKLADTECELKAVKRSYVMLFRMIAREITNVICDCSILFGDLEVDGADDVIEDDPDYVVDKRDILEGLIDIRNLCTQESEKK